MRALVAWSAVAHSSANSPPVQVVDFGAIFWTIEMELASAAVGMADAAASMRLAVMKVEVFIVVGLSCL